MKKNNFFENTFIFAQRYGIYALGTILLVSLAIRFALPCRDADVLWHVKYGEYMVENRTIVPDHSIYSWTPASNKAVYCTWVADILLYSIHQIGGFPLLFAFRYLCMLILLGIVWIYAWRMRKGRDVLTLFILLIVLLSSFGASYLKPEIISMIFMALSNLLYFSVKSSLWKKWGTKPFLLYPFLFIIWVNTHSVFLFGLIFLFLITLGEILNYLYRPVCALSARGIRHLLTGSILSLAATLITPYGYKLHLYIFNDLALGKAAVGMRIVGAYNSIFQSLPLHYLDFLVIMLLSFGALFSFSIWKRRELDWAILLPIIFMSLFFEKYLRCTYYLPSFWAMSMVYLQKRIGEYAPKIAKARIAINAIAILLFLSLSFRAIYEAKYRPFQGLWFGFGIGYNNPVQASAFLKKYRPGKLLYNSYDVGGYLIYDLYPIYKVFMDPRYFPYKEWFTEYCNFNYGATPLNEFLKKYTFDVAILDYISSKKAITKFGLSLDWKPVFYGPSAIIFIKKDVGFSFDFHKLDKHRFDKLHSLYQACTAFVLAQNLGELDTSGYILQLIKKNFSHMPGYEKAFMTCKLYQEGLEAFAGKDYEKALKILALLKYRKSAIRANMALTELRNWKAKKFFENGQLKKALKWVKVALLVDPNYADGLYNAGIMGYMIEEMEKSGKQVNSLNHPKNTETSLGHSDPTGILHDNDSTNWKKYLERFIKLAPSHEKASIVRQVLGGKGLPKKVPLIFPAF